MALTDVNQEIVPPHKGGGLFGSVMGGGLGALAGAIIGAAAAVPTGGGSLALAAPAIAAGAAGGLSTGGALGSQVGAIAGEGIDPSKSGEISSTTPLTAPSKSAPMMTVQALPEVQMATMQNSKNLLRTSDAPQADQLMSMLDQAMEKKKQLMGGASSIYGGIG